MTDSGVRGEIVRPDGATIAYDVAGEGPPVIFLHGLTNRRQGWDPVTSLLVPVFTCIRIDFRGHGESTPAPDYSMPSLVGDVRAVADELVLEPYEDIEGFERRVLAFPPEVVRGVWAQQLTTPPEELTTISEALLSAIKAPLLSLHGVQPPEDYPPWLTRLAPTAEVEVWDGMGHLLHLVDPSRFAERVRSLV